MIIEQRAGVPRRQPITPGDEIQDMELMSRIPEQAGYVAQTDQVRSRTVRPSNMIDQ
ncbi:MAG: hypothetical protein ACRDH9_03510 [Actinomycetota bacterium]